MTLALEADCQAATVRGVDDQRAPDGHGDGGVAEARTVSTERCETKRKGTG
jgi:hypothetical protein